MAIQIASFLIPKNGNLWFLLEDKFIKGGLQVAATNDDRDAIPDTNRKQGMLVVVQADGKVWSLQEDMLTWKEFKVGGGTGPRMTAIRTVQGLAAQDHADFELSLGGTAIIFALSVDGVCQVEAFETAARTDTNPYRFVSTSDHLSDDGSTLMSDGTILRGRRYTIVSNQDATPSSLIYFRITNLTALPTAAGADVPTMDVTLSVSFLPIEGAYSADPTLNT